LVIASLVFSGTVYNVYKYGDSESFFDSEAFIREQTGQRMGAEGIGSRILEVKGRMQKWSGLTGSTEADRTVQFTLKKENEGREGEYILLKSIFRRLLGNSFG